MDSRSTKAMSIPDLVENVRLRIGKVSHDRDWMWDAKEIFHARKMDRLAGIAGQEAEIDFLPSAALFDDQERSEVEEAVVAAAPVVQPIPKPPATPKPPEPTVPRCPSCGAGLEDRNLYCSACGAKLPDDLAVSPAIAVAMHADWEKLACQQTERVHAVFRRVEKGRRFSKQLAFRESGTYVMLLVAGGSGQPSTVADEKVLRGVLEELHAGVVLDDPYERQLIMKMLREKHGEKIWWE